MAGTRVGSRPGGGPSRAKTALATVFAENFRDDVGTHANVQRVYALAGEPGLLLCSWPDGGRPAVPFLYADEVWTGIEYQVAASLIYEGLVEEGLTIVRAVRERHAGDNRNPWDECECGHHYARAMSSWSLILALSGVQSDGRNGGSLTIDPRWSTDDHSCIFTTASCWGTVRRRLEKGKLSAAITIEEGQLRLSRLGLGIEPKQPCRARLGSRRVTVRPDGRWLLFDQGVEVEPSHTLEVDVG